MKIEKVKPPTSGKILINRCSDQRLESGPNEILPKIMPPIKKIYGSTASDAFTPISSRAKIEPQSPSMVSKVCEQSTAMLMNQSILKDFAISLSVTTPSESVISLPCNRTFRSK